jgi:hypothetical protein
VRRTRIEGMSRRALVGMAALSPVMHSVAAVYPFWSHFAHVSVLRFSARLIGEEIDMRWRLRRGLDPSGLRPFFVVCWWGNRRWVLS